MINFSFKKCLPVIIQSEAAECGLACIAMVASFYGDQIDLRTLRSRFPTSIKGMTLSDIIRVSQRLKLSYRPVKVDLDQMIHLKTPCILHWNFNHFVVLKKVGNNFYEIHDPARGYRKVSQSDFSESYTGIALELFPSKEFEQKKERKIIKWSMLIHHLIDIRGYLINVAIYSIALELFTLIAPFYTQWVVDQVIVSSDERLAATLGIAFIIIALLKVTTTALRSWVTVKLCNSIIYQWSNNVFGHLLNLPLCWFETRHMGDVVSKFHSLDKIRDVIAQQFVSTIIDGVMLVITVFVMFLYSESLTCSLMFMFIIYLVFKLLFFPKMRSAQEDLIVFEAKQKSYFLESLRGILPIKIFNHQGARQSRYLNITTDYLNKQINFSRLSTINDFVNGLVFGVGKVIIIWVASCNVINNNITVGMMIAFLSYADQFISRGALFINEIISFKMLDVHKTRLGDIILTKKEEVNYNSNIQLPMDKSIELIDVSFRYNESDPWVIKNLSLKIGHGEIVAITAPSGGGKSTLVKLILGLLTPTSGKILFGGEDISKLNIEQYRNEIAVVMQNDSLFAGSIAENIAFFAQDLNMDEIVNAAKKAAIHDEISRMPMNYNTLVGDMGSSLSGGQIQRILLARAIYKESNILILDEATSNLDIKNEFIINNGIRQEHKTAIIIAHRIETIQSADRVLSIC